MLFRMFWSFCLVLSLASLAPAMNVTDAIGRSIDVPDKVERVICSGSGCLRLLTYLQAQNLAVAVDDIESKRNRFDSRPYALANPQFKDMPIFGQFRGQDNPELILTLDPQPQLIFKTFATMGHDPVELQAKTGIPVVVLDVGNLGPQRERFYSSLRLMGEVTGKSERAEELIAYFEAVIADLAARTAGIPETDRPSAYLGGVAYKGPHGFQSTEPGYPPFVFVKARNLAHEQGGAAKDVSNTSVAKEQIVAWDPDYLFVDLSTQQMGDGAGGLHELRTDPAYATLTAVREGRVFGVLPYNWYSQNYESILANAYFIGKVLYPDHFADIDPAVKADEIYSFIVGKPVFQAMNETFGDLAYTRLAVR
ncbi:MAG: iron ABC transporter substrate-binding protein [Desulfomicrobium sp.]|nr:iron ABC transporter substrate-binding protein [Pseudomonadota bacterium]MBV1711453.1 iron ABC transporter substrate-binding protein [Desulfomicrobium sp.]MBU4570855.1 iron ABC transporter substrate-binding protein [Pseudomonadota bacterium]MBU4595345.1 iron ABC transporter substrate-binding protein [Pseudomonadota bacterium]MBV1720777.1 iron ABC transporter substrate-binding protein [Desulfomicrobium sp.]